MKHPFLLRAALVGTFFAAMLLPASGNSEVTVRKARPVATATPVKKSTPSAARKATPTKPRATTTAKKATQTGTVASSTPAARAPIPTGPRVTYTAVNVDGPYVALTFDDGPHKVHTPRLLDILAKRKVPATFFILGQLVAAYPEISRRIVSDGHEIANHTWDHPNLAKMSDAAVRGQLQRTVDIVRKTTGVEMKVFRPPYGAFTERQRQWLDKEFGYKTILWDVDPLDWRKPGASVVAQRILARARPGSIILVHDIHPGSVDAMPQVIDTLLAKGYRFVTVSQLLAMERKPAPPTPTPVAATPTPQPTPTPMAISAPAAP